MKLLRIGAPGHERPAMMDDDGQIWSLERVLGDISPLHPEAFDRGFLANIDRTKLHRAPPETRIGPCIGRPGKFLCIGLNYADHAEEAGLTPPDHPILFHKATSAMCGPEDDLEIPRGSVATDWEVELGVVIGRRAKYVSEADALSHVFGYCVVNDISERDFQMKVSGQWTKGKSHDSFGPAGPLLVTADEVPAPQALRLWCEVDGHCYQNGSTATMIFTVAQIISHLSQYMTLEPGDIISTGTPPGVGMGQTPPVYLKPGQTVRCGIDGADGLSLGVQTMRTVAA